MEIEETKFTCSNCNKVIPEEKLMIHEAYCFRNFIKCSKCEEMVDKNQKTEHEDDYHNKISCIHCGKGFSNQDLKNHELFCNEKPKVCSFCNLEIKFADYSEHIYICSTRTQKCDFCNKFIMKRDLDDHLFKCFQANMSYEHQFPHLNEENKNGVSTGEEEKITEDAIHNKKKLESPKLPNNRSPTLKKKNSRAQNNEYNEYHEYNHFWEQQDEVNHFNHDLENVDHHFNNQENNILLPHLPLASNMSSEDPELQRILLESLSTKKN